MYRSFQTPPESINYLFALARTSSQSEFFSDFGKVRKTCIQTSITKNLIFFAFLESTLGGKSTLGVCVIAQTIEICSTPLALFQNFKKSKLTDFTDQVRPSRQEHRTLTCVCVRYTTQIVSTSKGFEISFLVFEIQLHENCKNRAKFLKIDYFPTYLMRELQGSISAQLEEFFQYPSNMILLL